MPPTLAAARNTACGRFSANQRNTAAWSRRSSALRPTVSNSTSSRASRRSIAAPTIPRCPATRTVLPFSSYGTLAIGDLPPRGRKIGCHHLADELGEGCLRLPAELFPRLAGVAHQLVDFGRAKIGWIDANNGLAGFAVDRDFIDALAAPFDAAADFCKREFDKFAHRAGLARRQHEIAGGIGLQDPVHALDIVPGVTPVAPGLEVSQIQRVFKADLDTGDAARDLARHEGLAPDRALMVEQDAVRGEHAVSLAVVDGDPVAVQLGHRVGRARIERRGFLLRDFLNQTVE